MAKVVEVFGTLYTYLNYPVRYFIIDEENDDSFLSSPQENSLKAMDTFENEIEMIGKYGEYEYIGMDLYMLDRKVCINVIVENKRQEVTLG